MTRLKTLASVSTLAIGLALSGAAFADVTADNNNLGLGNASNGSNAATLSHQTNGNTTTGNAVDSNNPDSHGTNSGAGSATNGGKNIASNNSNSGNSSDSSTHDASNSGYGDASNGGKNIASNNSLSNVGNDQSSNPDAHGSNSGAGNASNGGEVEHSNNTDSRGDNSGDGNASNGGKNIASNNNVTLNKNTNVAKTDSSTHTKTIDVRAAVSNEELTGTVSGIVNVMGISHGGATASTGNINGGTLNGFAGIQTVSNNTGVATLNQAATSIAANANVTFGNANH